MKKIFLFVAALAATMMAHAQLPLDYTTFFAPSAVGASGELETQVYANTTDASVNLNKWNGSGKPNYHSGESSTVSTSTLAYTDANDQLYIDNEKGLMIESGWRTFATNTGHDDIFSLVNDQNTYTGKAYYASFLLRVDSCKSTDGNDIFAFDGNVYANAQRGRVFVKKGVASKTFKLGIAYNQANDTKGTNPNVTTCPDYAFGTTVLVVVKFTPIKSAPTNEIYETYALYVNPLLGSNENANTPVDEGGLEGATSHLKAIKGITVRQRANVAYHLAGLRFSDSWSDVVKAMEPASVTLGTNGWSTFCAPYAFTVSGATAYKVSADYVNNTATLVEETGAIPAGAGIILKGTEGANVTITPVASAAALVGNDLLGTTAPTVADALVLGTVEGTTGFYSFSGTIPAGKAYLAAPAGAPALRIIEEGNTATALENIEAEQTVKFIENGQLIIIKNGIRYNALGQIVK